MKKIVRINNIAQVHDFYGLEKPMHPLVSVIPIDEKITGIDYGDANYAFDFYHISLKLGIAGSLIYGRNSYDFQEGTIVFIKPNQTVKVEQNEGPIEGSGWTLIFHPDLIRKSELGRTIDNFSFFSYDVHEALHLSEKERDSLTDLVHKIESEYNQHIDKHSQELIISNIELLLKYCSRYYDRQFYTRSNLNKDFITQFESLLSTYFNSEKPLELGVPSVKYFGSEMNMSSHYLSDMLRKETGSGAQDHIYKHLIERAKTLLLGSNDTISQVAYSLGFEYPNHFSKLFKKKVGMSPAEYRSVN